MAMQNHTDNQMFSETLGTLQISSYSMMSVFPAPTWHEGNGQALCDDAAEIMTDHNRLLRDELKTFNNVIHRDPLPCHCSEQTLYSTFALCFPCIN